MFVDSDDRAEPDSCRIPLTSTKKQQTYPVMLQFCLLQNGQEEKIHCYCVNEGVKRQAKGLELIQAGVGMAAWNKLYHRYLFRTSCYPKGKKTTRMCF